MSRIDVIRIALTEYDRHIESYSADMDAVNEGVLSVGALSDIDEARADADREFVDDAATFIRDLLPLLDDVRVAVGSGRPQRTIDSAGVLANHLSHSGTTIDDI